MSTAYRTCHLCEATCGLEIALDGETVVSVRGDADDVFSHGYLCPKGAAIGELDADPDRLRAPVVRDGQGHREVGWDEAFAEVERRLWPVIDRYGPDAVAVYLGNPNVHNMAGAFYVKPFLKALRTRNIFSASTVDQMPKHVSSGLMFGDPLAIPVPDIDRTDWLLMLGANPRMSNGSLCTAPDMPGRLTALRRRGGRLVVVDPRRSRTAARADEHVAIRPGTDALLLAGMVATLVEEGLVDPGPLGAHLAGLATATDALRRFRPERVSGHCGVPADTIRRLARELAAADRGVVYGRIGTTTVRFGTTTSWLVDVLNALTGNLDRPGGAMFPRPAHVPDRSGRPPFRVGRWHSRVRGLPEVLGELPVATLADEIETEGEGQVRALVTIAGNPVLSTPNGERLDRAIRGLDTVICVDPYLTATARHADVVLPPPGALRRSHYDVAFYGLAIRNVANYSPPVLPPLDDHPDEWEILLRLGAIVAGQGASADVDAFDDLVAATVAHQLTSTAASRVGECSPEDLLAASGHRRGPERILDLLLRAGPYGDGFGQRPDGLSLERLEEAPHGIDLGPLEPRVPDVLVTASGRIELAPPALIDDLDRLERELERPVDEGLLLVGRRHLRTNNSWMHNLPSLGKGSELCTLQIHPDDAAACGLTDGGDAVVTSRAGTITVPVELTEDIVRGVVSVPHGWGHDLDGVRLSVARAQRGANSNVLTDEQEVDPLSGTAVLNGISVEVRPA